MSKLMLATFVSLALVIMPFSNDTFAAPDNVTLARAYVSVSHDGMFVVSPRADRSVGARLHRIFDPLNAELAKVGRSLRPSVQPNSDGGTRTASTLRSGTGGHQASLAASWCGYIPRWAFEAYAWGVIIAGGITATLALFASGTIFGLPAGAVLAAAGIWLGMDGSAMLWFVDSYMPPWGVYVCVF